MSSETAPDLVEPSPAYPRTHIHLIIEQQGQRQKTALVVIKHGVHMQQILEALGRPVLLDVPEGIEIQPVATWATGSSLSASQKTTALARRDGISPIEH